MHDTTPAERPTWVDNALFPFESHFVEIDQNTVHYVDEGSGPVLLMLHGNPTWSFLFRGVIERLRSDFRCIAIDYPGFGLSTPKPGYRFFPEEHADVVTKFIAALDLDDVTIVGQDWGGPIGLAAAQRRRDVVNRLILANTWAWPVNGDPYFEAFSRIVGGLPMRFLTRRFNLIVEGFIRTGHSRRAVTKAEMEHYRMALGTPARRQASAVFPGRILGSRRFLSDVESGARELAHLPTLIVWGGADIAFRDRERKRLQATFPRNHMVIVDDAGTYVESDAPDEFATAVRDFMEHTD